MANYKIELIMSDSKLENARVMDIKVGQKRFLTPFKTLNSPEQYNLLEIYESINEKLIRDSREKRTTLDKIPGKCKSNTVNLIIPKYEDTSISDKSICDLENRIHPHSDIIIIPRWDGILKSSSESNLSNSLWSMTKRYVEEVRRINGKLIMGNIPINRPQSVIDSLIDGYFKEGITSFVLDYEACQAPSKAHLIRNLSKKLVDGGFKEESILYQINMKKSHDYRGIKPADNLISFMDGIDILGNFHMRGGNGKEGIAKIFNPEDWAYFDGPTHGRSGDEINSYNSKLINAEAEIIKNEIQENGTVLPLAKKKKGAHEYTNMIPQTKLDFGGVGWN